MKPARGDIWSVDLGVGRGHEQSGKRPGLVISVDEFNQGPADLVVLMSLTTRYKGIPWHVKIESPEGGVKEKSYIKCEDIRSVSVNRLAKHWGLVSETTMEEVEDRLRILLDL